MHINSQNTQTVTCQCNNNVDPDDKKQIKVDPFASISILGLNC